MFPDPADPGDPAALAFPSSLSFPSAWPGWTRPVSRGPGEGREGREGQACQGRRVGLVYPEQSYNLYSEVPFVLMNSQHTVSPNRPSSPFCPLNPGCPCGPGATITSPACPVMGSVTRRRIRPGGPGRPRGPDSPFSPLPGRPGFPAKREQITV